jgi:DNA processing protein
VQAWNAAKAEGVGLLLPDQMPPRLAKSPEAPLALFVQGDPSCLLEPCVGIVGTRNASAYGRGVAKRFAGALAEAGATIVSGGALGIDAAAHEGALAAGGRTVAVLAGGIDKPYPSQNRGLFRRIQASGCLLSNYACGTLPERRKFLQRNELIAGLCDVVLVVEAPARSGALSTAVAARSAGRPIFVVPANIEADSFQGSHHLIRSGATLVGEPAHVAEAMGLLMLSTAAAPVTGLPGQILAAMTSKPLPAEKLAEVLGLEPSELMAELTMLELDGRVSRELGGYALVP